MSWPVVAIAALAALDVALSGFRASKGRSGLIDQRAANQRACRRGLQVGVALLLPSLIVATFVAFQPHGLAGLSEAARVSLWILGPYAGLVAAALGAYAVLDWRLKYLAVAVILGPMTWIRPWVATVAAWSAARSSDNPWVWLSGILALLGILAVEPLSGWLWHRQPNQAHIL